MADSSQPGGGVEYPANWPRDRTVLGPNSLLSHRCFDIWRGEVMWLLLSL